MLAPPHPPLQTLLSFALNNVQYPLTTDLQEVHPSRWVPYFANDLLQPPVCRMDGMNKPGGVANETMEPCPLDEDLSVENWPLI